MSLIPSALHDAHHSVRGVLLIAHVLCHYANEVGNLTFAMCEDGKVAGLLMPGKVQVSFGVHDEEQRAARMYDRAIILEKGRAAKTNFPLGDYDREVADVEAFVATR